MHDMVAQPSLAVLLVEDSPTDVLLTEEALGQSSRFRLQSCDRLEEALRRLATAHFDVVLLDLGLPDGQGLETLKRLRRANPHVAVVVLTGKDDEELAEQALHEGAQDYLVKGKADAEQLGRAIRHALERNQFEERLRKSEEHFRILVEGVKDHAILMLDPAGTVLTWNSGVEHILGYEAKEIIGHSYARFFPADDVARGLPQRILRDTNEAGRYRLEGWRVRKDGSEYWSNGSIMPVRNDMGNLRGFAMVTRDMSERKQMEDNLRASEELFRSAFDSTNIPMVVTGIDNRFLRVNTPFIAMFGYSEEELLMMSMADITHPDDLQESLNRRKAMLAGECSHFQTEKRYLHKDGRLLWGRTNVALVRGVSGEQKYYIGQVQDISEGRQVEADLKLRDRAIQSVTHGILIADMRLPDSPIIYASPGFERVTGYTASEAIGRNCRFLQGRDTDRNTVAQLREAILAGHPCTVELLNYRKDGSSFWNELSISPVFNGGRHPTHFVGVQTDVTGRRLLEEQLRQAQKMEAIGRLAGGVAHDFNNLLTVINGYSELIQGRLSADDSVSELARQIGQAGERAAALTRQLLAFSRKQVLEPKVLSLTDIVTDTSRMLQRLIGEDIDLITSLEHSLCNIKADYGQIEQILINLSVNARDAMPQGGRLTIVTANVNLDASTLSGDEDFRPGPSVMLSVTDTGTGMDEATKAHLFEPFFTTKGLGKGTGLGLATVFGIVKQSNGLITVESKPGRGACFKIFLPRVEERQSSGKSNPELQVIRHGNETVLLAEDEPGVLALARHILQLHGYKVLEANNGEKAVEIVQQYQGTIHLLVSDVVMPVLSGRQAAEQVTALRPDTKVLFLSGYTDDTVVRHGVLHAETAFLQKPFTAGALAQKVREVLDG